MRSRVRWRGISVQPGDMPLSERHAAEALSWSRNKLDRKLKALETSGLVTVHSVTRTGTMVRVVSWPNLSWLHDEATNGATNGARYEASVSSGSMVEPQTEPDMRPGTRPAWLRDEAIPQKTGSTAEPDWSHGDARNDAAGSKMEPNPIEKKSTSTLLAIEPEGFTSVWIAYPSNRRTQRREAARLVAKALEDGATIESILSALEAEKQSDDWLKENGRFVPGIVKWLEKENWRSFVQQAEPVLEEKKWKSW